MSGSAWRRNLAGVLVAMVVVAWGTAAVQAHDPRNRVRVASRLDFQGTLNALARAAKDNMMGVVTRASAQEGAKAVGIKIPGNQVWGVFHPRFAVRMFKASVEAGFEAPIRLYITEAADGRVAVSYLRPSVVFAPYENAELDAMAGELDAIFARIVAAVR